jgi:parallel beta-helix repeat protein
MLRIAVTAASLVILLVVAPSAAAQGVIFLDNACDVIIVPAEEAEAPEPGDPPPPADAGTVIPAEEGDTIVLTADSVCDPTFTIDPATGEGVLLTGNGIAIEADGVTLDLNGFDITSSSDVAAAGEAQGVDVENAGVSVGADGVTVTNSSAATSVVSEFTANFDFKATNSSLTGQLVGGAHNLVGGNAHGGGALAIDDSNGLTIDTVMLADLSANGDNGIDLKFSSNVLIQNSSIEGILTGIRIRGASNITLTGNTITGGCEAVEVRDSTNVVVAADNVLNEGANCPAEAEEPEEG